MLGNILCAFLVILFPLIVTFRFSRGPVQTILPPHRKGNAGRLCTSLGEKIAEMESEIADMERIISQRTRDMKKPNDKREDIELKIKNLKVKLIAAQLICIML